MLSRRKVHRSHDRGHQAEVMRTAGIAGRNVVTNFRDSEVIKQVLGIVHTELYVKTDVSTAGSLIRIQGSC